MNFSLGNHFNNDKQLAEECQKAKPVAQRALYQQYAKTLMLLCLRYVANEEDAKELLADSFVAAFKNFSKFEYRGEGSTLAWLKGIAINQCLMYLRKRKMAFETIHEVHEEQLGADDNILEQMSSKEIMQLIHNLPEGYRTVFNLYVFDGMQHKEIAALLRISESTSKSQLYKARQLLQKQILRTENSML